LVVGYMAIVGERQTGSVKILLGFPHSRRDIVAGKLLGRTGVVAVGIVVGFVVAAIAAVGLYGGFPARDFFGLLGVTLLLGMTFVGFAVGTSAAVATRGKAMATVIGVFVVFNVMWDFITSLVLYAATGNFFMEDPPTWFELLGSISPMTAYEGAARSVLEVDIGSAFGTSSSTAATASDPLFLQDWFGFVVLAAWMLVPLAIGYVRFQRANLG